MDIMYIVKVIKLFLYALNIGMYTVHFYLRTKT